MYTAASRLSFERKDHHRRGKLLKATSLFLIRYQKIEFLCILFLSSFFSRLIPISVEITALALSYHLFNGVSHLGLAGRWNFKSLKYFVFWLTVYAALAVIPVPSDLFLGKVQVILILGGSAALYFVGLASTPFEKEFCLNGFFFFPFGRYFVKYSRAHGSLSLYFNLSLRPIILTGRFSLFFSHAGKSFSIC